MHEILTPGLVCPAIYGKMRRFSNPASRPRQAARRGFGATLEALH
jgi:hypothetical protein